MSVSLLGSKDQQTLSQHALSHALMVKFTDLMIKDAPTLVTLLELKPPTTILMFVEFHAQLANGGILTKVSV